MSDYILFINSGSDKDIALKVYTKRPKVKIRSIDLTKFHCSFIGSDTKIWIDPSFDVYHQGLIDDSSWVDFMKEFRNYELFLDPHFIKKPKKEKVKEHLYDVLDYCNSYNPDIISVPQLPYIVGTENNAINKMLAVLFLDWKVERKFSGDIVLPVIFTHKDAVSNGTERTKKIEAISKNFNFSGANGVWVVDSSLQDQTGTGNFEKERFPALVDLHVRLNDKINPQIHIAGPYWGVNILLWARSIITNPAFSLGAGFKHYLPGGRMNQPSDRVAIPSLKRWAKVNKDLKEWLDDSINRLKGQAAEDEFLKLSKELSRLEVSKKYKTQIAEFYLSWYQKYESLPVPSRPLALYQDLSESFVLGKSLGPILSESGTARKPEVVAKQLMLNVF